MTDEPPLFQVGRVGVMGAGTGADTVVGTGFPTVTDHERPLFQVGCVGVTGAGAGIGAWMGAGTGATGTGTGAWFEAGAGFPTVGEEPATAVPRGPCWSYGSWDRC